jgi:hypothetical protein
VRELGTAYERLLMRYVAESLKWHAADSESIEYGDADNAMLEISELMEPLEEQIKELEIDHLDQNGTAKLRAVALKDLRYKLPVMHDEYEISDGFGDDLEMFWQVLTFVGLAEFARTFERRAKDANESREALALS